MTVGELIEALGQYDKDAPVRLGTQPSYPFQWSVAGVIDAQEVADAEADQHSGEEADEIRTNPGATCGDFDGDVDPRTVYVLEGGQLGYFARTAWEAVR